VSSSAALACRLTGRRVFVSDLGGGGWDISRYISTDNWYHNHLHISSYSRKYYGHEGKPWAHVVYGGVDTEKFKPEAQVRRENTIVFVGRLLAHKGVDQIIEALPDGMKLELIGQPYDEVFLSRLRALAEGKDVVFRHNASDDDIVNAYRRALCVVLPSVYRTCLGTTTGVPELLGQTLLEGMACGTPAICTDVASMPEIVENGKTGFVVPPHEPEVMRNRLVWLRDHAEKRETMGAAARQAVMMRFQWNTVVEKCLAIYRASNERAFRSK
jgi:glycosyltransferase involved in cell wall biosynthesis